MELVSLTEASKVSFLPTSSALQVDIVHHLTKTGQPPPTKSCQESSHILVEPHTCLKQRGTERLLDGVPERHSVNSVLPTLTQEKPYSRWCLLGRRASTGERGSRDEQPLIRSRAAPLTARNHNSSSLIKCSSTKNPNTIVSNATISNPTTRILVFSTMRFQQNLCWSSMACTNLPAT